MERFALQPILSTTKLRKMIDVGAVSRDLFRFLCRFGRARARASETESEQPRSYRAPANVGPARVKRIAVHKSWITAKCRASLNDRQLSDRDDSFAASSVGLKPS
jgi:hypothetical protein